VLSLKSSVLLGVWVYMAVTVVIEVMAYYAVSLAGILPTVIGTVATSQAVAVALFYMGLKDEPGMIRILMLVALMFLAGLLIAMVASLG
jgi:hypothetical protein